MIFQQIDEILSGQKTQTRRVVKPSEGMYKASLALTAAGNVKWAVGKTYAVQPGRGLSGLMWIENWAEDTTEPDGTFSTAPVYKPNRALFTDNGWREFRIRITAIRQERLQDITEDDAKAEGVSSKGEYAKLWNRINKRKGTRWSDNPLVWVLAFEVVKEKGAQS